MVLREVVMGRQILRDRQDDLFFEVSKTKGFPYFVEGFVRAKFIFQEKLKTKKEVLRLRDAFFKSKVPSRFVVPKKFKSVSVKASNRAKAHRRSKPRRS